MNKQFSICSDGLDGKELLEACTKLCEFGSAEDIDALEVDETLIVKHTSNLNIHRHR